MEGERAVGCIRNGFLLAGGGSFLLSLPLPLVIFALQILEEPTGCGGIVEWGLIGSVNDLDGIISLLTLQTLLTHLQLRAYSRTVSV